MEAIRGGWACTSGAKPAGVLARPKPHQTESLIQSPKGAELRVGLVRSSKRTGQLLSSITRYSKIRANRPFEYASRSFSSSAVSARFAMVSKWADHDMLVSLICPLTRLYGGGAYNPKAGDLRAQ